MKSFQDVVGIGGGTQEPGARPIPNVYLFSDFFYGAVKILWMDELSVFDVSFQTVTKGDRINKWRASRKC